MSPLGGLQDSFGGRPRRSGGHPLLTHHDSIVGLWRVFPAPLHHVDHPAGARRYATAALFHRCDEKVFIPFALEHRRKARRLIGVFKQRRDRRKKGDSSSTGGGPFPSAAALLSAPVIESRPDCPFFAVVCLELPPLDTAASLAGSCSFCNDCVAPDLSCVPDERKNRRTIGSMIWPTYPADDLALCRWRGKLRCKASFFRSCQCAESDSLEMG
jgi:hypothetical protein